MILCNFILNSLVYSKFIQMHEYTNMFWIYLEICSLPDCRTLPHALPDSSTLPHTLLHIVTLPDTAVRFATQCRTLHEFECRKAAHHILHIAHSRTPQLTRACPMAVGIMINETPKWDTHWHEIISQAIAITTLTLSVQLTWAHTKRQSGSMVWKPVL
jgi:hypothetical protein